MKLNFLMLVLSLSLLLTATVALLAVFFLVPPTPLPETQVARLESIAPPSSMRTKPLWRVPVSATANHPTPLPCGWLLTERNGHIRSLTGMGETRWQASYSNYLWQASAVVDNETLCAITQKGQLVLFDAESGSITWSADTQASCLHPPVVASIDTQRVILLLSQEDGILTCVNASDGTQRWKSPPTSRTDGPLLCSGDLLAYGNCDAAVYLFSLTNGQQVGSIQLEDDEQVAGGILPLPDNKLLLGTRKGTLVLLDSARMKCVSRMSLSDAEAFATPALVATDKVLMPVADGRLTFWRITDNQLVAEDVVTLASSFDETVIADFIFWAIAQRKVYAVCTTNTSQQVQFMPGDELRALSPGCYGKTALLADGDFICVKGF